MNKEIEIKVKLKDYSDARIKVRKIAKLICKKKQVDEFWTPKHKNIYAQKHPEYFRVRQEGRKTRLEYHVPIVKSNKETYTAEYETNVEDGKMLRKILKLIDAHIVIILRKERELYKYGDFEICLDRVEGLGYFMEVEAKKIMKGYENTLRECIKVLESLNLDCKIMKKNYFKLAFEKEKNKKINN